MNESRKRRQSTKLLELKNQARRDGWLRYIREGEGEEADERALLAGVTTSIRGGPIIGWSLQTNTERSQRDHGKASRSNCSSGNHCTLGGSSAG